MPPIGSWIFNVKLVSELFTWWNGAGDDTRWTIHLICASLLDPVVVNTRGLVIEPIIHGYRYLEGLVDIPETRIEKRHTVSPTDARIVGPGLQ